MPNKFDMSDEIDKPETDSTGATPSSRHWTRQDYALTSIAVMIKMGDGVELYLPGVITQKVSCELGVSALQEGFLAIVLFVCYAVAVMISLPILRRFGEKFTLLLSLYLSIVFAILCAVVPNYYTLLLSRALTGLCAGLNGCTIGIYIAKYVSSKDILNQACFLSEGYSVPAGGAWVSLLGWLLLDVLGWRIFVLLTSIPLFLPPIFVLHFCISETQTEKSNDSDTTGDDKSSETDELINNKPMNVPNLGERIVKSSLFFFCSIFIGFGSIILLPWLIRSYKVQEDGEAGDCKGVVQGNDLLILAAVTGAANIIGRPIGYFLWKRIKFLILQLAVTSTMAVCYAIILTVDSLIAAEILLAIAKLCYSIQAVEIAILHYDYDYFGMSGLEIGCGVSVAAGMFGSVVGTTFAAFLHPEIAVLATLVVACIEVVVICFMKERF